MILFNHSGYGIGRFRLPDYQEGFHPVQTAIHDKGSPMTAQPDSISGHIPYEDTAEPLESADLLQTLSHCIQAVP